MKLITTAIRSVRFWGYAAMLLTLSLVGDRLVQWTERCPCHEDIIQSMLDPNDKYNWFCAKGECLMHPESECSYWDVDLYQVAANQSITCSETGLECDDYSSMGSMLKALGNIVIVHSLHGCQARFRAEGEHVMMTECVVGQKQNNHLERWVGDKKHIAGFKVCPSDFGEPGTRLRFVEMAIEKTMMQQANMMRSPSQMFGRSVVAFPDVYWTAPDAKVAEMALVASQQRGLPVGTPWLNLLLSDMKERVLGNEKRIGQSD